MLVEEYGDVFDKAADMLCVLTNQQVNKAGRNVMGAGQAWRAAQLFPGLARDIGARILDGHPEFAVLGDYRRFDTGTYHLLAHFPTKVDWRLPASLELVEASARGLMAFLDSDVGKVVGSVLLPRPGCGLGGLDWESQVRPLLEPILDARVLVCTVDAERPPVPGAW